MSNRKLIFVYYQSTNASWVCTNASFIYINAIFVYTNATSIYRLLLTKTNYLLKEKKLGINEQEVCYYKDG